MVAFFDDVQIKRAYKKLQYTPTQIDELKACMHEDTGPLYFIENFVYIQHPMRGKVQLQLYDYQYDLVEMYHNYRRSINMISRQMGKTTIAAGYLLWYAMFVPDSTILIASNQWTGAQEIMHRVRYAYECIPDHIRAGVKSYNKRSITFDNESRIIATATTETTGRGMALSLVYLDEFAFVPEGIAREFWTSLSPTLATGGKCIITSTPNTDEDMFSDLWFGSQKTIDEYGNHRDIGKNGFKGYMATWEAHPDRDTEWAKAEEESIGIDRFLREHLCQFVTFEETLINPVKLSKIEGTDPLFKSGQVRWYAPIRPECTYVVALDPSMGTGGDNAAIQVLELPTLKQVAEWQSNKIQIEDQIKTLRNILSEIDSQGKPELYWSVENNNLGEAALVVIRETGEDKFCGTFLHDPANRSGKKRSGFTTTNKSKLEACAKLKSLLESDKLKLESKNIISELKTFVARNNTFEGKVGQTDDLVMGMLLALRMTSFISTWDDTAHKSFSSNVTGEDDVYDYPMPLVII